MLLSLFTHLFSANFCRLIFGGINARREIFRKDCSMFGKVKISALVVHLIVWLAHSSEIEVQVWEGKNFQTISDRY